MKECYCPNPSEHLRCAPCFQTACAERDAALLQVRDSEEMISQLKKEFERQGDELDSANRQVNDLRRLMGPYSTVEIALKAMEKSSHHCMATMALQAAEEERDAANRQNNELRAELIRQKDLWEIALPILNVVDDKAGMVPFGQLHYPLGSIDRTLSVKRKCDCSQFEPRHGNCPNCGEEVHQS